MSRFSIRTDLAIETAQILTESEKSIEGVEVENIETGRDDIFLSRVKIKNEKGRKDPKKTSPKAKTKKKRIL